MTDARSDALVESAERSSFPASATSPQRDASTRPAHQRHSRSNRARRALPRHLRRHAVALCGSTEAPTARARALHRVPATRFPEGNEKVPHVGWNSLDDPGRLASSRRSRAGEFVYFTHSYKAPVTARYRSRHTIHRALRRCRRARQRHGRAVSSGKIRRDRPEDSCATSWSAAHADQTHHRLPRRARTAASSKAFSSSTSIDAGDPAALAARHAREGADEIVLLDITATHEGRATLLDTVRRTARELFVPFTRRRRHSHRRRCSSRSSMPARTRSASTPPRLPTRRSSARSAAASERRPSSSPSMRAAIPTQLTRSATHKSSSSGGRKPTGRTRRRVGARGRGSAAPAKSCSPRWTADGTRAGFDCELTAAVSEAVSIPVIASGGAGTRRAFRRCLRTRARPMRRSPPASFTSAFPSARSLKEELAQPAFP